MELNGRHRETLSLVGYLGATAESLRGYDLEIEELARAHLIVFRPHGAATRPAGIHGVGAIPGRWYLTKTGAKTWLHVPAPRSFG